MASFNRVIIAGNLTRDPEYKQIGSGQALCKLGIASNRQYKNRQNGETVQEVCFVDVDVWGPQADSCNQYLQKGRNVLVEGRLKLDQWQDNEGQNRSRHTIVAERVVFLGGAQADTALGESVPQAQSFGGGATFSSESAPEKRASKMTGNAAQANQFKDEAPFEDDLPF